MWTFTNLDIVRIALAVMAPMLLLLVLNVALHDSSLGRFCAALCTRHRRQEPAAQEGKICKGGVGSIPTIPKPRYIPPSTRAVPKNYQAEYFKYDTETVGSISISCTGEVREGNLSILVDGEPLDLSAIRGIEIVLEPGSLPETKIVY